MGTGRDPALDGHATTSAATGKAAGIVIQSPFGADVPYSQHVLRGRPTDTRPRALALARRVAGALGWRRPRG